MYTKRVERAKTEEMKTDTIFFNLNKKEYSEKMNIKLSNQLLQKRTADEWLAFSLTNSAFKVCEHPRQTGSKYPALPSGTPGQGHPLPSEISAGRLNPFLSTCGRFSPSSLGLFLGCWRRTATHQCRSRPTPNQVPTLMAGFSGAAEIRHEFN